jgi:hypothetical protein
MKSLIYIEASKMKNPKNETVKRIPEQVRYAQLWAEIELPTRHEGDENHEQ